MAIVITDAHNGIRRADECSRAAAQQRYDRSMRLWRHTHDLHPVLVNAGGASPKVDHMREVCATQQWFAMRRIGYKPAGIVLNHEPKPAFPTGPSLTPEERWARDIDLKARVIKAQHDKMYGVLKFDLEVVYQLLKEGLTHMANYGQVELGTEASGKLMAALLMVGKECDENPLG